MSTLIALFALAGSTYGNIPAQPSWKNDYSQARLVALEGKKPLAVFIGSGVSGWQQVSADGGFQAKVNELLKDKYVCVYVDTDTAAGKNLAKDFQVDGKGLVISDKSGKTQAFHHSGDLNKELLEKALVRHADTAEAAATETVADLAPKPVIKYQSTCPSCSNYAPSYGSCPGGNCPR
jgi:hypothetical protein